MRIRKAVITIGALSLACNLPAAWQLVDNFEDGNTDGWEVTVPENAATLPALQVVDDPANKGQGKVLKVFPGVASAGSLTASYVLTLPAGQQALDKFPAAANTTTLYMKVMQPIVNGSPGITNCTFGMASKAFLNKPLVDWSWPDYSVLARVFTNNMDQHTGTGYVNLDTTAAIPANNTPVSNTYYEYWFVIDRTTQLIDGYIKGGQWANQSKVWTGSQHRTNPGASPIDTIFMRTSNDGITTVDSQHFDDIYIDNSGVANLSTPGGGGGATSSTKLVNISTRGQVGTGANVLIGGFTIQGESPQKVLIRAAGPALGALGVPGTIADPVITLRKSTDAPGAAPVATNTKWGNASNAAAIATAATTVGAFDFASGSNDAAILMDLAPGGYTAEVAGNGGVTGVSIIEVYAVP